MKEIKTTIRINSDDSARLAELYGKFATGIAIATTYFLILREKTIKELCGIFTESELSGMIQCLSKLSHKKTYMIKPILLSHLEEAEELERLSAKCDFSFSALQKKVAGLTAAQACFLMDLLFVHIRKEKPLEQLVRELTAPSAIL